MIRLLSRGRPLGLESALVAKVVTSAADSQSPQPRVLVTSDLESVRPNAGLAAIVSSASAPEDLLAALGVPVIEACEIDHIGVGDVLRLDVSGTVRTLFRRLSRHNTLFATERCNSLCVMCSQPPRQVDDDWRIDEMLQTIALVDKETAELGISGGEPTLLGEGLLRVLSAARDALPETALHILSNGRLFRYAGLADAVGAIRHHDLMFGIPLYSARDSQHDYVVQAQGAFEDTMLGLHNLARAGVPVEIRVVIHRHTYRGLAELAEFIYRNLTFASHVALMGLEATGYAKANMDDLWVDPMDYQSHLATSAAYLASRGMRVSIYNHPLCVVPADVWPLCRQSISDWKNEFHSTCNSCAVRDACGGFFSFNLQSRITRGLAPISQDDPRVQSLAVPTA